MHKARRSIYGVAEAFHWNAIPRVFLPSYLPRFTCRSFGTSNDCKDGKSRVPSAGQFSGGAEKGENPGSSSSPNVQPEMKKHEWQPRWPSKGSKRFSPTVALHILPLLEATPEDPIDPQAEQTDRFMELLTEPSRPRPRNDRALPSLRRVLPRSFRKAILGDYAPRSASTPTWFRPRKLLPRDQRSTELLEQELQLLAHGLPYPDPIRNILTILIKQRQVRIAPRHYEALILMNCHPKLGSIESVKSILREIYREELPIIPAITFAVVKVCHPQPSSFLMLVALRNNYRSYLSIPTASFGHTS